MIGLEALSATNHPANLTFYAHIGIICKMNTALKPLHWVATALDDLRECPEEVQDAIGYALHIAQEGGMERIAPERLWWC